LGGGKVFTIIACDINYVLQNILGRKHNHFISRGWSFSSEWDVWRKKKP